MINFIVSHFISINYANSNEIFGTLVSLSPFFNGFDESNPYIR